MQLVSEALTTLATIKNELSITDGDQDDKLTRLINAASQAMAQYCHRRFDYGSGIVEKVSGYGSRLVMVSRTPLLALTEVKVSGAVVTDASIYNAKAGLVYRRAGWPWAVSSASMHGHEPLPGEEELNVQITYDGGWVTPVQAAANGLDRTLPFDLEQLAIETVVSLHSSDDMSKFITSESLMSASYSYDRSSSIVPASILETLRLSGYVRVA